MGGVWEVFCEQRFGRRPRDLERGGCRLETGVRDGTGAGKKPSTNGETGHQQASAFHFDFDFDLHSNFDSTTAIRQQFPDYG